MATWPARNITIMLEYVDCAFCCLLGVSLEPESRRIDMINRIIDGCTCIVCNVFLQILGLSLESESRIIDMINRIIDGCILAHSCFVLILESESGRIDKVNKVNNVTISLLVECIVCKVF
jgi:hypothetical protein